MIITPNNTIKGVRYDATQVYNGEVLIGTAPTRAEAIENCLELMKIK